MKVWTLAAPLALTFGFGAIPALATSAPPAIVNAPRLHQKPGSNTNSPSFGWSSSNWSGYAVTGQTYHSITDSWIVPKVTSSHGTEYSSSWIGIDGFNNSDLIQTGTEQDASKSGASYSAWWEILPAAETTISGMTIHPGDVMQASIVNNGNGTWTISLKDTTSGQSFSTTQSYSGPAQSAEWIEEAPTVGGRVATLANYGQTTFDPGTVNGQNPGLVTSDGGVMIQRNAQVSTPSVPDSDTDGFNIAYGSSSPAAPNS
ncbi:G1 family glutamic endopeptidase [Sulfobacillus harzensis]|uniref:Peptidase A4 family protein n=1 Tax=Sulfobacillus harzensis TaxID=2729629 RepID=A0A7Y0L528_9FIRM|nr:G1 family glutamic endopeptidase [Sulfobacillus harzensis]NMP23350.1 hypothetical protein [Sulfobacillus harzensis]